MLSSQSLALTTLLLRRILHEACFFFSTKHDNAKGGICTDVDFLYSLKPLKSATSCYGLATTTPTSHATTPTWTGSTVLATWWVRIIGFADHLAPQPASTTNDLSSCPLTTAQKLDPAPNKSHVNSISSSCKHLGPCRQYLISSRATLPG